MNQPDWNNWRQEFPGLKNGVYLNTVSLGQLSRRSRGAVNYFLDLWEELGSSAWYNYWLNETENLRVEFAKVINASADEIAIMPNISSAIAAVGSSLDYTQRNRVVSCELDFPTITHNFLAKRDYGVETCIIPAPDRVSVPLESFKQSIDEHTSLVATCRVYFTSGHIQDIKEIADMAHQMGAYCLIDDYQGCGQIPIDVKKTGVDFLVTGGLKWLIGGPGVAYLYVRRELIHKLKPRVTGWFSHQRQFDFDPHTIEFRKNARRFEAGTPSVASVYAATAGLEIINQIGPENLRERSSMLNQYLVSQLKENGHKLRIPNDPSRHASITLIEIDQPMKITHALADKTIVVDKRPDAVRVSPYFYNTLEEIDTFVHTLNQVVKETS